MLLIIERHGMVHRVHDEEVILINRRMEDNKKRRYWFKSGSPAARREVWLAGFM